MQQATVINNVFQIEMALNELGLSRSDLETAILEGEAARDSCTPNDPKIAPGIKAWIDTVRCLRDILRPRGWVKNEDANFSTVVHPDGTIAIVVATGNDGTGNPQMRPNTKYPKGAAANAAFQNNNRFLFPEMEEPLPELVNRKTWVLLKRRLEDQVYFELSLPAALTPDGLVERWLTRIIFPPLTINQAIAFETDESPSAIDVPVRRRSSGE